MAITFDQNGNLKATITLPFEVFKKTFGLNESRKEKINRLLLFLKILKSMECDSVYVVGSFVSKKEFPGDIDICVDATGINYRKLVKEYPEFLEPGGIEKIRKEHQVHFAAFFDAGCREILDWFKKDRDDNKKGVVRISLKDIEKYD